MSPDIRQKIEEIFLDAVDIENAEERAAFLDAACASDIELRGEVEKLIRQDMDADDFLDRPLIEKTEVEALAGMIDEADPLAGRQIGSYRIVRSIGAGGMGSVYLAERSDGAFRKEVAVKIVKRGMDTDFILRRFRQERQILARLDHPFIASLLDGGTTDDGRPYFVMEYVNGVSLYKYADRNQLTIRRRLELFVKVCSAVEYAHRSEVVHRDLKPSNILIRPDETPRLLDFGIAKVFNPELQGEVTMDPTHTAHRLMTPEYASPEQVKNEPVSAASDIYSLGVVLYELLTGHRPYRLRNRAIFEVARVICEEPPAKPSAEITKGDNLVPSGDCQTLSDVCASRGAESIEELRRAIEGDLERIVFKALRKDPLLRYRSVGDLTDDISNYLNDRPVNAEPFEHAAPGPAISSGITVAILPMTMIGGSAATTSDEDYLGVGLADALVSRLSKLQRFVVRPTSSVMRFQDEVTDSFAIGRELDVEFLIEGTIRRVGDRLRVSVKLLSVKEGSTRWAENFDERMGSVLEIEDSISERVAATLVPQLTGAEQAQISKRGTNSPEAHEAYMRGRFFWNQFTPETFSTALRHFERAVEIDPEYAIAHASIADYYRWAMIFGMCTPAEGGPKARSAVDRALEIDPDQVEGLVALAFIKAFSEFDWTEGERLLRRAIELNPSYGLAHELYSALLAGTGRTDDAVDEILLAERLEPLSIRAVALCGWHLYQNRRFEQAIAKSEEVVQMNPLYFLGRLQRGNLLIELGRADEAVVELERAISLAPIMPSGYYMLAFALTALGRRADAEKAVARLKALPQSASINAYHLGLAYTALGDRDRAFEWLRRGVDERQEWFVWIATEKKLDALRGDERFRDLLRRTNRAHLIEEADTTLPERGAKTFAVLPFKLLTIGPDAAVEDDRFLSIGLADSLIGRLSKLDTLILRPTSSVVRFTEPVDAFEAGRELNASYILDGTIRRLGERVRISAQLHDLRNLSTVWAESFDEDYMDIFDLEDAVASRVAATLIPTLTGDEIRRLAQRPTDSAAAYDAYLRGRYHLYQVAPAEFTKAKQFFEEAIRLDPGYALAYAGLAEYYFVLTAFAPVPSAENLANGKEMAERALDLDESIGEAWAIYAFFSRADLADVERILQRSVELSPNNPLARVYRSGLFIVQRRFDEAVEEARLAVELNPLSPFEQAHLTWILYQSRRFPESIEVGRRLIAGHPHFSLGLGILSLVLAHAGSADEAVETARRAIELNPQSPTLLCGLAIAYSKAGHTERAAELVADLLEIRKTQPFSPFDLAVAYLNLGDLDRAFAELRNAALQRVPQILWLGSEPELDPIRTDERFIQLVQMIHADRAPQSDERPKLPA